MTEIGRLWNAQIEITSKSRTLFVNLVIAGESATLMQARSLTSYNPIYRWLRD